MAQPWEEALDLDDSDLPSLRPFKRQNTHITAAPFSTSQPLLLRCSQTLPSQNPQNLLSQSDPQPSVSPRLIPGPAGTVQAAMLRRRKNPNDGSIPGDFGEELIPTQEYIRRAVEDGVEDDDDFTRDPWLSAVNFIRLQGLVDGDGAIGVPLSAIKSKFNMDKVAQVVSIVKSCTPNGLGGMMVTLKDPTGTMDATIHGRVLTEAQFEKDISIGAVIILRKVTVFSPSRSAHYLNITLSNVVKVISNDGTVPWKQHCSLPMIKHGVPVNELYEKSQVQQKPFSVSQGMTEGIMNCLRPNSDIKGSSHNVDQVETYKTRSSCPGDGNKNNQNAASGSSREQLLAHQDGDNGAEVADETDKEENNEEVVEREQLNNVNPSTQAARGNVLEGAQSGSAVIALTNGINDQGGGNADGAKWRQPTYSNVAIPQWTDEQLEELCAFD